MCALTAKFLLCWIHACILLPLTLADKYEVPMKRVNSNPFESYYIYPIQGNNLYVNDTHVFWPTGQKLYSKFYIKMASEGETLFGISQQQFTQQRHQLLYSELNTGMVANDHLALIKTEGNWRDHKFTTNVTHLDEEYNNIPHSTLKLKGRVSGLAAWLKLSNFKDVWEQGYNPAQLSEIQKSNFARDTEPLFKKLREEMSAFKGGIGENDYHNFEKSAFLCLHVNLDDIEPSIFNGVTGWWVPLKRNFVSWRGMNFQEPVAKLASTIGVISMDKSLDEDSLEVVLKGSQFFRGDVEGIEVKNLRFDMGPPNDEDINDNRPEAPEKPGSWTTYFAQKGIDLLESDTRLPWVKRNEICPQFEETFRAFKKVNVI